MVVLESCPKHNMVAYLENTDGNTEFHEIISFLTRSSIHYALTVSPVVSTTFVEQFCMSDKSKLINNVRYITAKLAGKPVSISEASIRSHLLFNDADGIYSLANQAIFDVVQLMGKVFSFMVKKGKHFSGKVTPLFPNMLVQPTEDEGEGSERPSEPQPIPSPPHPKGFGGNHGDQANEIKHLKVQIKKLKKKAKPVITPLRAWMMSGRKSAKAEPSVHKDPAFDELDDDAIDYMETEDAQDVGRTRYVLHEEKESIEKEVSTEDALSTDKQKVSTDKEEFGTDRPDEGTDKQKVSTDKEEVSTDRPDEGTVDQTEGRSAIPTTPTPTPTIFEDDETISQVLLNMSQAKAVSREKGKGEAKEERKRLAEEEATNAALIQDFDDIKARIEADRILELRFQEEEREQFTMEERAKFLHDIIAAQRRFLAKQRAAAIRNRLLQELKLQELYEKVKRFDESFTVIGSTDDERKIKEMNEGASDPDKKKKFVKEDVSTKVPAKADEGKAGEIMERKSVIARLNKVSSPDRDYLVIYRANGNSRAFNYLLELEDGTVSISRVEMKYPLSKELLQRMLDFGLEVEVESTAALDLIRHKNWLVHKQMTYGKDFSNLFMVDNLPKIVGFSTHLASWLRVG
ncbi:hypothetical protein Tco_1385419 [Tanacetum coccineum]